MNPTAFAKTTGINQHGHANTTRTSSQHVDIVPRIKDVERCQSSTGGLGQGDPNLGRQSRR
jgi:hypothetical protein